MSSIIVFVILDRRVLHIRPRTIDVHAFVLFVKVVKVNQLNIQMIARPHVNQQIRHSETRVEDDGLSESVSVPPVRASS